MRTWPELRHQHLPHKGEKDRAIGEAFDRHGGDKPLQTQPPQHGNMAPPIDGLRRLCSLAPRRTGVKTGYCLMAARFVEKHQVFRGERLAGILQRGPLPLDLWLLLLGSAKAFFARQAEFGQRAADRRRTHRDLLGSGPLRAQLLERCIRGRGHECLEGLKALSIQLGRRAASMACTTRRRKSFE